MSGFAHPVRVFVAHYGLIALFVLLTIEEAGIWLPIPGDLLVVYFGYRVLHTHHPVLYALRVLLVVTLAVLCGSTILYSLTHRYRYHILRFGRLIHLDEKRLHWMEEWLQRRGPLVLLPGRLIPGLRIPTTVVSGLFDIPLLVFLPAIAFAGFVWGAIYLAIGIAGRSVLHSLRGLLFIDPYVWVILGIVVMTVVATVIIYRRGNTKVGQH